VSKTMSGGSVFCALVWLPPLIAPLSSTQVGTPRRVFPSQNFPKPSRSFHFFFFLTIFFPLPKKWPSSSLHCGRFLMSSFQPVKCAPSNHVSRPRLPPVGPPVNGPFSVRCPTHWKTSNWARTHAGFGQSLQTSKANPRQRALDGSPQSSCVFSYMFQPFDLNEPPGKSI